MSVLLSLKFTMEHVDCISYKIVTKRKWKEMRMFLESHDITVSAYANPQPFEIVGKEIDSDELLNRIQVEDDEDIIEAFRTLYKADEWWTGDNLLGDVVKEIKDKEEKDVGKSPVQSMRASSPVRGSPPRSSRLPSVIQGSPPRSSMRASSPVSQRFGSPPRRAPSPIRGSSPPRRAPSPIRGSSPPRRAPSPVTQRPPSPRRLSSIVQGSPPRSSRLPSPVVSKTEKKESKALRPEGYYETLSSKYRRFPGKELPGVILDVLSSKEELFDHLISQWAHSFEAYETIPISEFDSKTMYKDSEDSEEVDEDTGEIEYSILHQGTAEDILDSMMNHGLPKTFQNGDKIKANTIEELKDVLKRVSKEYPHWFIEEYMLTYGGDFIQRKPFPHDYSLSKEESEQARRYLINERDRIVGKKETESLL